MKKIKNILKRKFEDLCLFEMACDRKTFKKLVQDNIEQIIENWCLIDYVVISGDLKNLKNHWKAELRAACKRIVQSKIKENNSYQSREKVLNSYFKELWELDKDPEVVRSFIEDKFSDEGIKDNVLIRKICENMVAEISYLVDILATGDYNVLKTYIEEL